MFRRKLHIITHLAASLIGICVLPGLVLAGEIHDLAVSGSTQAVANVLAERPLQVNALNDLRQTPLHCASGAGMVDSAKLLIARGALVNARAADGRSPLHLAVESGSLETVSLLLESGARVNSMDVRRRTPLAIARAWDRTAIADLLLSNGGEDENASTNAGGGSVRHFRMTVSGCPVDAVYANLDNRSVRLTSAIPESGPGSLESFGSFVRRLQPTAAINGTFFCRSSKLPIGDIVIAGNLAHAGGTGTAMCITADNRVCFRTPARWVRQDWSGFETVICAGPRLVANGRVVLNARSEGFRDPHVLGTARRTAVGLTYMNRLLLLTTRKPCTLTKLAYIMKTLGCTDAINFDGGSSSALYYRGKAIIKPSSALANVLLVYD